MKVSLPQHSPVTAYHAKYFAYDLTRRCPSDSVEKLLSALSNAQVDLNPHQVDAALFAFSSPFSKGAILADEVGLGKTIEAGLLLAQKWAERKRRLLVVAPSNLRKQWSQELQDKFFLPSIILENKSFNDQIKQGKLNPFDQDKIVITSYQFLKTKEPYIRQTPWDMIVIDEAHRLRNVYKASNKIANSIKQSTAEFQKVLLTATPLQNSLLELYGLVSMIDDYTFGDLKSFKAQFSRLSTDEEFLALRERIRPICKRTLRKQVLEYVPYTNRHALVQEFYPTAEEDRLYNLVSEYLQRPNLYALPASQRKLMTLILRKLLASSSYAITDTLGGLVNRLKTITQEHAQPAEDLAEQVSENYEEADSLVDEWDEDEEGSAKGNRIYTPQELEEIQEEKETLIEFHNLARSILRNSKGEVLLTALRRGMHAAGEAQKEKGSSRLQQKAIIFTESRRTQEYLFNLLQQTEFAGKVILFNGSNTDALSKEVYQAWLKKHEGTDRITGSPTADKRAALVEHFRDNATIMIATEAAAEGINLQFCNLIVNYDLPWNPQRIEQRIGRCHRYGQAFDVIVVNFLNKANAADLRVYELLAEKFKLFNGVFGASDEVLGAIESGVDFEKRIADIFQRCRTPDDIKREFDQLQETMEENVAITKREAREKLLNNFDQEVIEKVKVESFDFLGKFENRLWEVAQYALQGYARFDHDGKSFVLEKNPFADEPINPGPYRMAKMVEDANIFRVGHPLAQRLLGQVKGLDLPTSELKFDLSGSSRKVSILSQVKGKSGWLVCRQQSIQALEAEDHIIMAGLTDDGELLDGEQCQRMFDLPAQEQNPVNAPTAETMVKLQEQLDAAGRTTLQSLEGKNSAWFEQEINKLDKWAEDKRATLRIALQELEDQIKAKRKEAKLSGSMPEKLALQREVQKLDQQRDEAWKAYDAASKTILVEKDRVLDQIEARLKQHVHNTLLFTLRFTID
jgi:superfamily II DNA or RNA helicase